MFLFYQEASARKYKEKVVQCYNVANPKKLDEVDKILKKYKGNEHVLFSQVNVSIISICIYLILLLFEFKLMNFCLFFSLKCHSLAQSMNVLRNVSL